MPPQDQTDPMSPNPQPSAGSSEGLSPRPNQAAAEPQSMARPSTQFRAENYSSTPDAGDHSVASAMPSPSVDPSVGSPTTGPEATPAPLGGSVVSPTPDVSQSNPHMPGLGSTTSAPDVAPHKRNVAIIGIAVMVVILVVLLAVILTMGSK